MSGRLGAYDLTGGVIQSIATGDTGKFIVATLNITNRNWTDITLKVGITDVESELTPDSYIEHGVRIGPKGTFVRTGLIIPSTKYLTVLSSHSNVSAVAWGVRTGTTISVTPISTAVSLTGPTWVTPATFNWPDQQQLIADDDGVVEYSLVSGVLPSGLVLQTNGRIGGTATTIGQTETATIRAINPSGNNTDRTFTITTTDETSAFYPVPLVPNEEAGGGAGAEPDVFVTGSGGSQSQDGSANVHTYTSVGGDTFEIVEE